jgi:hypothetical protein
MAGADAGQSHMKISAVVEPLANFPPHPPDSCDKREVRPLAECRRFFPVVFGHRGNTSQREFRPRVKSMLRFWAVVLSVVLLLVHSHLGFPVQS